MPTKQLNTDAVLRPYQQAYDDMPRKYRIEDDRVPLWRQLVRALQATRNRLLTMLGL